MVIKVQGHLTVQGGRVRAGPLNDAPPEAPPETLPNDYELITGSATIFADWALITEAATETIDYGFIV